MKIFKFDPETGRRGAHVADWKRASWTAARWNAYDGHEPVGFGRDAEVTVHHDAGITSRDGSEDISYRTREYWICFCLGCWRVGHDENGPVEHWEWIVLPPHGHPTPELPVDPRQIDYPADSDIDTRYT